jgi:hypothetical protein
LKLGDLLLGLFQEAVAFFDVLVELCAFILDLLMFCRVNTIVLYEGLLPLEAVDKMKSNLGGECCGSCSPGGNLVGQMRVLSLEEINFAAKVI